MRDSIKKELENIIKKQQINTVFQPIISLIDGSIYGYEALSRINSKGLIDNPEMLFEIAKIHHMLRDVELLCQKKALEIATHSMVLPHNKKLLLNINPDVMSEESFITDFTHNLSQKYKLKPDQIIFEISEHNMIKDIEAFKITINNFKSLGYSIAIDDAGAGYSGLNLISDIVPNFIKIDKKLIHDIHLDRLKLSIVKGMVEISKASGIALIAEGIETKEEFKTLINIGVQYGQGYYIQKPKEIFSEINEEIIHEIEKANLRKKYTTNYSGSNTNVLNLGGTIASATPYTTVDVRSYIMSNSVEK